MPCGFFGVMVANIAIIDYILKYRGQVHCGADLPRNSQHFPTSGDSPPGPPGYPGNAL
jgi:hypothetical protein